MSQRTIPTAMRVLLIVCLAAEGLLLLRPDGALVHAAQPHGYGRSPEVSFWWRESPVHMGCSVRECPRPATRIASYRIFGPRGITWRAYGFCDLHQPPEDADGLVYRLGRPRAFNYDLPLAPAWAEIYLLLGAIGFGLWCTCTWRWAQSIASRSLLAALMTFHLVVVAGLWRY